MPQRGPVAASQNIDETLEHIQIPLIRRQIRPRIPALTIHFGHWVPPVVENVEFFAVFHHEIRLVSATHYIDISVLKFVMCRKRSPAFGNRRQPFYRIISQMKLENVSNWPIFGIFKVASRDHYDLLVRYINCAAESQLLIKSVLNHVINILRS